jgi:hypothetical protein
MEAKMVTYEERVDRATHLAWCKKRALEYVEAGDVPQALASLFSDLGKHKETANHQGIELGALLMLAGMLGTNHDVRHFIEGLN